MSNPLLTEEGFEPVDQRFSPHGREVYARDQHTISRKDIDPDALKIMYRLIRYGYKAYLVGGGVRDLLLKKRPKDFDIATDATPRRVKDLFRNSRIIGRRFKLIHVFFRGNKIIEVSTFRDEGDPIDPESVEEVSSLMITRDNTYGTEETDAIRRDISINALFYDLSTFSIIDYVGGMRDMKSRVVRMIGDPDIRFAEDPVRLLRVVRHASRTGFSIDPRTHDSLCRNAPLIRKSAAVRVYEELRKDFSSAYVLPILRGLSESGLLDLLLPEVASYREAMLGETADFASVIAQSDQLVADGRSRSPTVVLALIALFQRSPLLADLQNQFADTHEISDHIADCFRLLTVPRKERERIETLLYCWHECITTAEHRLPPERVISRESAEDLKMLSDSLYGDSDTGERIQDFIASARTSETGRYDTRRRRGDNHSRLPGPERGRRRSYR